ncbi:MAG: hypothetical protein LBS72_10280 [Oscillospiraceae bacterium]|nr:hypothetical protein [Oscillospiraceae bacterium]
MTLADELITIMKGEANNLRVMGVWRLNIFGNEEAWLERISGAAFSRGYLFVMDCGEGKEMPNPPEGEYIEDIGGWLFSQDQISQIPHSMREEKNALFERDDVRYVIARWESGEDEAVRVRFE